MCGICGVNHDLAPGVLEAMVRTMEHRGPDDEGIFTEPGVGLAMRRLSIVDLEGGRQPIANETGDLVIVCNGEIFNFQELRRHLELRGHRFSTRSDTEIILHLFEDFGPRCVEYLNGMFVFAIWNRKDRSLFLARDRLGVKPLYFWFRDGRLAFASEIKAILKHPEVSAALNLEALDNYLTFQYVPGPDTMFQGIQKLLPGHWLRCRNGAIAQGAWWDLSFEGFYPYPREEDYEEHLLELLDDAVKIRLMGDVPYGAFLSGGIDSSTVVALMARHASGRVKTFTVGFDEKGFDETHHAGQISRLFNTEHYNLVLRPEMAEWLPRLIWHFDEPVADMAALPTFVVSRLAREKVKVVLTGEGSDEILAGYPRYFINSLADRYHLLPDWIKKWLSEQMKVHGRPPRNELGRLIRKIVFSAPEMHERHIHWIGNFYPGEKEQLYSLALRKQLQSEGSFRVFNRYFRSEKHRSPLEMLQYLDIKTWMPDNILMKVDKMSMAASLEARVPFLDYRLVEFSAKIPPRLKMRGFSNKDILKRAVGRLLPRRTLTRRKQAFNIPARLWFRNELQEMIHAYLLGGRLLSRGLFEPRYVQRLAELHFSGKFNVDQQLWNLLCLELWFRAYLDGDGGGCYRVGDTA